MLAAVKHAARRLRRWPAAMLDRVCARRLGDLRPGRRNGSCQPNKETWLAVGNRNDGGQFLMSSGGQFRMSLDIVGISVSERSGLPSSAYRRSRQLRG